MILSPKDRIAHVLFMMQFTPHITILACDADQRPTDEERKRLEDAGALVLDERVAQIRKTPQGTAAVQTESGCELEFDAVYPILGIRARSELASRLGAKCSDEGELIVDVHQRTSVPGLFAVGDVVSALNQISVAVGQAAIATSAIHRDLLRQQLSKGSTVGPVYK
jgi:thioredoxin reductase (NADPH)